jgi:hypothetical protein
VLLGPKSLQTYTTEEQHENRLFQSLAAAETAPMFAASAVTASA